MKKLLISFLFLAQLASGQVVQDKPVNGTFDESSYNAGAYRFPYFALHWYCMYPQFTNHIYSVSGSGASWEHQFDNRQPQYCFPLWYSWNGMVSSNYNWMLANDNGGYNTTNPVVQWGTNLANAPPYFWDGSTVHDYSGDITAFIQHRFFGGIPNDSSDGDEGAVNRDLACIQLAQLLGLPATPGLWNPLMDYGWRADLLRSGSAKLLGFYAGGHPYPAGHLVMTAKELEAVNAETNVGGILLDWQAATAITNHSAVTSISILGNVLTCTIRWDRMPPGYDWPDGTHTNNCLPAFVACPDLANFYQWMIGATNIPDGNIAAEMDGELIFNCTAAQLRAGMNQWTNRNGPLARQRYLMLDDYRDREGADHVTVEDTHGAGDTGVNGWEDTIRLQSQMQGSWTAGHRGVQIYNDVRNTLTNQWQFDVVLHNDAQQTSHTLVLTLTPPPPPPKHLRIKK